jgi:hypothetical protein
MRTCAVRAHVRRAKIPDAYANMHMWLRIEVAMNEACQEILEFLPSGSSSLTRPDEASAVPLHGAGSLSADVADLQEPGDEQPKPSPGSELDFWLTGGIYHP